MTVDEMDIPGRGTIGENGGINQDNSPKRKHNPQRYMFLPPNKKVVSVGVASTSRASLKPNISSERQGIAPLSNPSIRPAPPDEVPSMSTERSPLTGETRALEDPPKTSHIKEEEETEDFVVITDSPPTSPLPTQSNAHPSLFTPPSSPSSSSEPHPHIATKEDRDAESSEESSDTQGSDEEVESEEDSDGIVLETVQTRPSPVRHFRVPRRVSEVSVRRLKAVFPNGVEFHCMDSDSRHSSPAQFDSSLETTVTACPHRRSDHPHTENPYFEFDSEPKGHLAVTFNAWNIRHILGVVPSMPTATSEASGSACGAQTVELDTEPNLFPNNLVASSDSRDGGSGSSCDFEVTADFAQLDHATIPSSPSPQMSLDFRASTPGAVAESSATTGAVTFDSDVEELEYPEEAAHPSPPLPDIAESPSSSTLSVHILPVIAPAVTSSDILSMELFRPPSWPKSPKINAFASALTESLSSNAHTKSKKRRQRERQERRERDEDEVVSDSAQEDQEDGNKGTRRSQRAKSPEDDFRRLEAPRRKRKIAQDDSDIDAERQRSIKRKGKQRARDMPGAAEAEDPVLSRKRRRAPSVDALSDGEPKPRSKRKPSGQQNTRLTEPVSPNFRGTSLENALNSAAQSNQSSFRQQTHTTSPRQAAQPEGEHTFESFQNDFVAILNANADALNNQELTSGPITTAARRPPSKKAKLDVSVLSPRPSRTQHTFSAFAASLAAAYNGIVEQPDDADTSTPRPATTTPRPAPSSHSPPSKPLTKSKKNTPRIAARSHRNSSNPTDSPPSTSSTLPAQGRMAKKPHYFCESDDDDDNDEPPEPILQDDLVSLKDNEDKASPSAGPSTAPPSRPPRRKATGKIEPVSTKPTVAWPYSTEKQPYCHPCRKATSLLIATCSCSKAYCIRCLRTRFENLPPHMTIPTTTSVSITTCPFCEGFCTCPYCQKRKGKQGLASTSVRPGGRKRKQAKAASPRPDCPRSPPDEAPETPLSVTGRPARKVTARPNYTQYTQGDAIPGPSSLPQTYVDEAPSTLLSVTGRPARRAAARPVYNEQTLWDEDEEVTPDTTSAFVPRARDSSKRVAPTKLGGGLRVYCHQCRRPKDSANFIRCAKDGCRKAFCEGCLRHRYRTIPSHIPMPTSREFPSATCPLCEGWCNCDVCTVKRGKVYVHRKYNTEAEEDEDQDLDEDMLDEDESDAQEQSDEDERYPVINLDHIQIPMADMEALGVSGLNMGPLYHPVTTLRMGTGMLVASQEEDRVKPEDLDAAEIGTKDDSWDIDNWEKETPRVFCVRDEDSQSHFSVPDGFVLYST